MKTMTVVSTKSAGDKLLILNVEVNGKAAQVKAWKDNPIVANLKAGQVLEAEVEKKSSYKDPSIEEYWLKSPPKPSGGGGRGVAKSDPAKNQVIKEANQNNNSTMAEANRLNNAALCIQCATQVVTAKINLGEKLDESTMIQRLAEEMFLAAKQMADGKTLREVYDRQAD